jgi:hypothetical protein
MYSVYRGSVRLLHGYDKPKPGYIKALERAGYEVKQNGKAVKGREYGGSQVDKDRH